MNRKKRMSTRAVSHFDSHYNCAESVLLVAKETLGIPCSAVPGVATGFGAGIGRRGSICGALTGAIMAIGLAHGRSKPTQDREKAYGLALKTFNRFVSRFGSPYCIKLTGCDMTTARGRNKFTARGVRTEKCNKYVSACAGMVADAVSARVKGPSRKARRSRSGGRGKRRSRAGARKR